MTNEASELFDEMRHAAESMNFGLMFLVFAPKRKVDRAELLTYRPDENEAEVQRKVERFLERRFNPLGMTGFKNIGPGVDRQFIQIFEPHAKDGKVVKWFNTTLPNILGEVFRQHGNPVQITPESAVN